MNESKQIILLCNKTYKNFQQLFFMQTDRLQKQKPSSFFESAPKRSLSYNDLKRKRLIRSQKSKTKLHPQGSQKLIIRTQKKKPQQHFSIGISSISNTAQDVRKIQRSINELKDVFDEIKQKAKTKKYIMSKPFYTDRTNNEDKRKISFVDKSTLGNGKISVFYESLQMAGNDKQLIKQIISKKKSQRRLLKFDQIRAQVKRSKSKSKLNIGQEQTATNSKINQSSSRQILQCSKSRKNIRINKFQTVREKPYTYDTSKGSNTQAVNRYQTTEVSNQNKELSLKSHYRSRRKLKIDDFKTQRKDIDLTKDNQHSNGKLKLHRRLRKTNSEIVIKTTQVMYNKSKYMSRVQNKSTILTNKLSTQSQKHQQSTKKQIPIKIKPTKKQVLQSPKRQKHHNQQKQQLIQHPHEQINLLKDLQLSAINISQIQMRKSQSFTELQSQISIVNAIQAQQLQLQMKRSKPKSESIRQQSKQQLFKKCKKQTPHKSASRQLQNAQNLQNLSNILDFISLPTEQLKVKINRCSTKIVKKKNEMEKFKKIFPANFFNK